MNWPFKKKKEMIDLSYLAKRGLIKLPERKAEFQDLPMGNTNAAVSSDALGFLSGLAATSESASSGDKFDKGTNNKIEDFEFKLNNLIRRIDQMFDRLDLVEKKLGRNERAGM
jgi:hypothetical protein